MWSTHGKLSRINFDQVWATIKLRTYFSIRYFFSTPNNFNQPVTCDVDIFELKPETKNQKLIWKWVFIFIKEFQFGIFLIKVLKRNALTLELIKSSRKHKIWTMVIYIYQLKNIFCFFFLSNLSFHLGWNYKPEIKLYQMNSETHNFLCKYTQQVLADKTW